MKYLLAVVLIFFFLPALSRSSMAQTVPNANGQSRRTLNNYAGSVSSTHSASHSLKASFRPTKTVPNSMSSEWNRWESILDSTRPDKFLGEMTAEELIVELSEIGLPLLLHNSAREDALSEDDEIELKLPGRTLRTRLLTALEEKNAIITFCRDHISIISKDDAEEVPFLFMVTYDVSGFGTTPDAIVDIIQNSVSPDSWQDTGQGLGTAEKISVRGQDLLTVVQTYNNQMATLGLLNQFDQMTGGRGVRNLSQRRRSRNFYNAGNVSTIGGRSGSPAIFGNRGR
ncbi:MAG: hypothetical protein AB8B55_07670 [Mariniblastus sp.]